MENSLKRYAKNSLLISVLLFILSFFLIFNPAGSLNILNIILGCVVLVNGIVHAISYFSASKEFKSFSFELVEGIVCVVLGLLIIFNPNAINNLLTIVLGAWIILDSIIKIQLSFNMKSIGRKNWSIMLILSIVTIIFGLIIILNPFATIITVTVLCGILLLITELINIFESVSLLKIQ